MKGMVNLEEYYPYSCEQCGNCCRHVDFIEEMSEYDRGDGVCKYLNNNKCKIYNARPNICNGKFVYENFYSNMTVAAYHEMIKDYCELIRSDSIERFYKNKSCNR